MIRQTERARQRRVKAHLQQRHRPHMGTTNPMSILPGPEFSKARPAIPVRSGVMAHHIELTLLEGVLLIAAILSGLFAILSSFTPPYSLAIFLGIPVPFFFGIFAGLFIIMFAIFFALHPRG